MRVRPWLIASTLVVCGITATGCTTRAEEPAASATTPSPSVAPAQWAYEGTEGPDHWDEIDPAYETCGLGEEQSPIDLPSAVPSPTESVTINVEPVEGDIADNGHTLQLTADDGGSTVVVNDVEYELQQLHAHTPSEHTINGRAADGELHLVHAAKNGDLLVVAILVNAGAPSAALEPFVSVGETAVDTAEARVDLAALLPTAPEAYQYQGSLTTPPCSEPVTWIVLSEPGVASIDQLNTLAHAHGHNARPTQPLNDRQVGGAVITVTSD